MNTPDQAQAPTPIPAGEPAVPAIQMGVPVEALLFDLVRQANAARCDDDNTMSLCVDLDSKLKNALTKVNENHTAMTSGLVETKRFIDERKKKFVEAGTAARDHVQGLVNLRRKQLQREEEERANADRKAAEERALEEAQRLVAEGKPAEAEQVLEEGAELAAGAAPVQRTGPVRGATAGAMTFVEHWMFEVEDLALVPREWLVLDEKKVRAAIKPKDGVREIPGLKIYSEDRAANR